MPTGRVQKSANLLYVKAKTQMPRLSDMILDGLFGGASALRKECRLTVFQHDVLRPLVCPKGRGKGFA